MVFPSPSIFPYFSYTTPHFLFNKSSKGEEAYLLVAMGCANEEQINRFWANGKQMLEDPCLNLSLNQGLAPSHSLVLAFLIKGLAILNELANVIPFKALYEEPYSSSLEHGQV